MITTLVCPLIGGVAMLYVVWLLWDNRAFAAGYAANSLGVQDRALPHSGGVRRRGGLRAVAAVGQSGGLREVGRTVMEDAHERAEQAPSTPPPPGSPGNEFVDGVAALDDRIRRVEREVRQVVDMGVECRGQHPAGVGARRGTVTDIGRERPVQERSEKCHSHRCPRSRCGVPEVQRWPEGGPRGATPVVHPRYFGVAYQTGRKPSIQDSEIWLPSWLSNRPRFPMVFAPGRKAINRRANRASNDQP